MTNAPEAAQAASVEREPALDRRHLVAPPHVDLRVGTSWRRIREARAERRARRRRLVAGLGLGGGGLVAVAAVAWLVMLPGTPTGEAPATWAGATLRTSGEPTRVALADGSNIEARPESELALLEAPPGEVRVAVRRGGATFEVTHRERPRRFVVQAGDVEVRVIGTRFQVERRREADGSRRVEVRVSRGLVEVALAGQEVRRLGAGERWSIAEEPPAGALEASADQKVTPPASVSEDVAGEGGGEAEAPGGGTDADEPGPHDAPDRRRPPRAGADGKAAAQLVADAKGAARQGDAEAAARAWEALLRRHPRDDRAPLAAFELGRLRMDRLDDPPGAVAAFRRALQLGRRSPFQQDVLRRLVELYESLGDQGACQRLRERYLDEHPSGRYAAEVARRCGGMASGR